VANRIDNKVNAADAMEKLSVTANFAEAHHLPVGPAGNQQLKLVLMNKQTNGSQLKQRLCDG